MGVKQLREHTLTQGQPHLDHVSRFEQLIALAVDDLTLVIGHIIVLKQLLADIKIARFDLALRRLNRTRHDARFNRFVFRHFQPLHHRAHAVTRKNAQQRIIQRQIKTGRARVTLTTGATT